MRARGRKPASIVAVVAAALLLPATASASVLSPSQPSRQELERAIERTLASGQQPRELKAPRPAWFTQAVEEQLRQGGGVAAAPVDAPLPGEVGIRPGSLMISPFVCTMNFIFRSGETLAIGTAGHCVEANEPVVLLTVAPTGGSPVLVELGPVLLRRDSGIGQDYALVQIPPERHAWVFPTMPVVGGPCGIYAGDSAQPVAHYGHGLGIGTGGTPRVGMGFELGSDPGLVEDADWDWDEDSIVWLGLITPGDSGSPVRTFGFPAVSNVTHGIALTGLEPSAVAWGTRVTTITGGVWTLVNSPLCL